MLPNTFCTTSQDAALLLLRVREIAFDELLSKSIINETNHRFKDYSPSYQRLYCDIMNDMANNNESSVCGMNCLDIQTVSTFRQRSRTISLCSSSEVEAETRGYSLVNESPTETFPELYRCDNVYPSSNHSTSLYTNLSNQGHRESRSSCKAAKCVSPTVAVVSNSDTFDSTEGVTVSVSTNKKDLGTRVGLTDTSVRDVLRKKFSWKSFPELERYLIDHRSQYLQYSNQLNYTAEQKRYNNRLTQGLLDLAAVEGYLFEDFTFAAVRDRIRCYYKSYVQANKKKKLKRSPLKS
jgi:hypothetical protein